MFNFSRYYKHLSQTYLDEPSSHAQQQCMSSSCSITSSTFDIVNHFRFSHSRVYAVLFHYGFNLQFLLTKVEPLFMLAS